VYLVLADSSRRESEIDAVERPREAAWISASLRAEGRAVEPETAERMLELHRLYRTAPPPDEPIEEPPPTVGPDEEGRTPDEGAIGPDDGQQPQPASVLGDDPDVKRD
jgi:hypothetical protein